MKQQENKLNIFLADPRKALITLSIPIMIGMLGNVIYHIVDAIFIGLLGPEAIAAIAFSMPIFMLLISLCSIGTGVIAQVAQYIGAKNKVEADNSAEHGVLLAGLIGLLVFFGMYFILEKLLFLFGARGEVLRLSYEYSSVILWGAPILIFSSFFNSILAGEGDTKTGAKIYVAAFVLNIILDPILIFGFGLGIKGAAYATVASFCFSFILLSKYLFVHKNSYVTFNRRDFKFDLKIFSNILKVGVPSAMTHLIYAFNAVAFNKLVSFYGFKAVAAVGVGMKFDMFYFMPLLGFSNALVTLSGMFIGAKKIEIAKKALFYSLKLSLSYALVVAIFYFSFTRVFILMFTRDPAVIAIAFDFIRISLVSYLLVPITLNIGKFIQGSGSGMPSLIITSFRILIINIPLAYYFTRILKMPIYMLWWSPAISGVFAVLMAIFFLKRTLNKVSDLA